MYSVIKLTFVLGHSIWFTQAAFAFQAGHAQAGENPELCSLFFKLAHLLQVPITPLFVFDGACRPAVKCGVNVITKPNWTMGPFQELLAAFGFQYYTASVTPHRNFSEIDINSYRPQEKQKQN